jgi:hypothetical protein
LKGGWESFLARCAGALLDTLNRLLPPQRYLAVMQVRFGSQIEADIAELESPVPVAAATVPIVFPDDIEIQVLDLRDSKQLVGVIELITPRTRIGPKLAAPSRPSVPHTCTGALDS